MTNQNQHAMEEDSFREEVCIDVCANLVWTKMIRSMLFQDQLIEVR